MSITPAAHACASDDKLVQLPGDATNADEASVVVLDPHATHGDTVAIGLGIVAHGFEITAGSVEAQPEARDSRVFLWRYRRGEIEQDVYVVISATAMASATEALRFPIDAIVASRGRSAVEDSLRRGHSPTRIAADSSGSIWEHPAD